MTDEQRLIFAEVIIPLAAQGTFTYAIPNGNSPLQPGSRVLVGFGKQKIYAGIVQSTHSNQPDYKVKPILDILDSEPVINENGLKFWQWMADYYMCSIGEVCEAAMPAMLKMHSETRLYAIAEECPESITNPQLIKAFLMIRAGKEIAIKELQHEFKGATALKLARELSELKLIGIREWVSDKFKPKTIREIELVDAEQANAFINSGKLDKTPAQKKTLQALLQRKKTIVRAELKKEASVSDAAIKALINKDLIKENERVVNRFENENEEILPLPMLSPAQQKALEEVQAIWSENKPALLYGVTSSGKTELYFHLIKKYIDRNEQALVLLPEIALTGQLVNRFRMVFGDKVGVYHSRIPAGQRIDMWHDIRKNEKLRIIVGPRSAMFLPYNNLSAIIIDEEHDRSYKQQDPAPRYNARDAAIVFAHLHQAKVLMGTATPSLESLANNKAGKYGMVRLTERYGNYIRPSIEIVDYAKWWRRHKVKAHLTPLLFEAIEESLANGSQVILFQNRRGYAPYVQCMDCGEIPFCPHCDVRLTLHKFQDQLVCHYCGFAKKNTEKCDSCGKPAQKTMGFGTEKIEQELQELLPHARISRFDQDSTRRKNGHETIINNFESGKIDILIGTQMVTKGIDFKKVSVVGVLNADNLFSFPDFRSFERSMQLLTQVAGRAGRHGNHGRVIIQTSQPEHTVIQSYKQGNYGAFTEKELLERFQFAYPPFTRIITVSVKHKKQDTCHRAALLLAGQSRKIEGTTILGPQPPVISRIQQYYIEELFIKIERSPKTLIIKNKVKEAIAAVKQTEGLKSVIISADVDPY
ncbi:MAG: primosomal protein N' [Salinivirgaceae bacterium]